MPISVFISYAHEDEELENELLKHLALLRNEGVISTWDDRALVAGAEFDAEIARQLETADLILLLVSADFIASEYCWSIEMKRAVERHRAGTARVIPVILRAVDWQSAPFGKLTAAPTDGRPVTSWPNRDEALLDVAQHIRRAATELKPRSSSAPRKISNVPPPNPNFTGREDHLAALRESLTRQGNAAIVQAISGMGGVGKTQLALMYAARQADEYGVTWWIRSEQTTTIASDLAALATPLGLPERDLADQSAIVEAVRRALRDRKRWLLLFDNVERMEDVQPFLPLPGSTGHVIVTSRNPAWGRFGRPIEIDVLPREESIRFLLNRTGRTGEDAAANLVAEALGDLPLALEQAGAYIEKTGDSLEGYLDIFNTSRAELWKREATVSEVTVATTLHLSLEKVKATDPAAIDLLKFYSFLAPDDIPRALFDGIETELLTGGLAEIAADKLKRNEAIAVLRQYSLVNTHGEFCDLHRLVQFVVRDGMGEEETKQWAGIVAVVVMKALPSSNDAARWADLGMLMPHAWRCVDMYFDLGIEPATIYELTTEIGHYLKHRAEYARSIEAFRRCIAIATSAWGVNHPVVARSRMNLAAILADTGDVSAAMEEIEVALRISRDSLGSEQSQVVQILSTLGFALIKARRFDEAGAVLMEAVQIDERLGEESDRHFRVTRLMNLSTVLVNQDRPAEAMKYLQRARELTDEADGANFVLIAILHNLAVAAVALGDYDAARRDFSRALDLALETYGDHPNTHRIQIEFARLCVVDGMVERAVVLADAGIAGFRRFFGQQNQELAERVTGFSVTLKKRGHEQLAAEYARRAREMQP